MNEAVKDVIKSSMEIDQASADVYRISLILRLCALGMQNMSTADASEQPFKHDSIGDALEVLCDKLDECRMTIANSVYDIDSAMAKSVKQPA